MVHWSSRGRFHGIRWSPPLEFSFPGIRRSLFVGALRGRVLPLPATMRTCESHVPVRAAGVCALVRWSSLGIRAPGLRLEFSRDSVEPSCPGPPPLSLPVLFGGAGSLEPTLRFGEAAGALSVVRWAIRWSRSSRPGVVELVIGAHSVFWRGGWGSV